MTKKQLSKSSACWNEHYELCNFIYQTAKSATSIEYPFSEIKRYKLNADQIQLVLEGLIEMLPYEHDWMEIFGYKNEGYLYYRDLTNEISKFTNYMAGYDGIPIRCKDGIIKVLDLLNECVKICKNEGQR